jgi:uncharacterized protein (TIGR02301 family)
MGTFQALPRPARAGVDTRRDRASVGRVIFCGTFAISAMLPSAAMLFAQPKAAEPAPAALPRPAASTATAPYDEQLLRLAEILGSVHYLRNLCKSGEEDSWRSDMQRLLDAETKGEDNRKEKFIAAFNRGYRSFASVYTDCTAQAVVAEERYRAEGATLATEITARFGN